MSTLTIICTKEDDSCQNGGVCVISDSDPIDNFCECPAYTNGLHCHQVLAPPGLSVCMPDGGECLNGGSCVVANETVDGKVTQANYCDCPLNTFGDICHNSDKTEQEEAALAANEAAFAEEAAGQDVVCTADGNQCENNGFCQSGGSGSNYCVCPDTHTGIQCKALKPVISTGSSLNSDGDGFPDDSCVENGNNCSKDSTCILKDIDNNIPASYCKCNQGYFGKFCNGKHEAQLPPTDDAPICTKGGMECQNSGVCVMGTGLTDLLEANYCACPLGTSGDRCEKQGICDLKCEHGSSCRHNDDITHANTNDSSDYCECVGNYKGKECEIQYEMCPITEANPEMYCLYGGKCVEDTQGSTTEFACECPAGRSGVNCETGEVSSMNDYNGACFSDKDCSNSGLCVRSHDADETAKTGMNTKTTQCLCPLGWGGENCELKCDTLDCQHGSSCKFASPDDVTHANDSAEDGAYCDCKSTNMPFKGRECEIAVMRCPGDNGLECLYGGSCIGSQEDSDGDFYSCACPSGRMGKQCEYADSNYKPSPAGNIDNFPGNEEKYPSRTNSNTLTDIPQQSPMEIDMNILVVSVVALAFLLLVPITLICLKKNRDKKNSAANATVSAQECLDGVIDVSVTTENTDSKSNGHNGVANGDAETHSDDIFDYDTDGVVNVNLDENEPVPLPKDKQIV